MQSKDRSLGLPINQKVTVRRWRRMEWFAQSEANVKTSQGTI